jgi:hypothetical protein
MKTVVAIGALALSAYLFWMYSKQHKATAKGGCGCDKEGADGSEVSAPKAGAEADSIGQGENSDVARYQTSPLKTFNTPERLIVDTSWPTDGPQAFSRR